MKTNTLPYVPPHSLRAVSLPDIITVDGYARHVGLHPSTVRAQLRDGRLPGRRVGRRWLIARLALIAHLAPSARGPRGKEILP